MKIMFYCNEVEKDVIVYNGRKIDKVEGDVDLNMVVFKFRDV